MTWRGGWFGAGKPCAIGSGFAQEAGAICAVEYFVLVYQVRLVKRESTHRACSMAKWNGAPSKAHMKSKEIIYFQ